MLINHSDNSNKDTGSGAVTSKRRDSINLYVEQLELYCAINQVQFSLIGSLGNYFSYVGSFSQNFR